MDEITYFPLYILWLKQQFQKEWKKKPAHTAHMTGKSLQLYTNKMRRSVFMKCYNVLQIEKESFFKKLHHDDNEDDLIDDDDE